MIYESMICACMGPQGNDPMCPCQMRAAGMTPTSIWTDKKRKELKQAVIEMIEEENCEVADEIKIVEKPWWFPELTDDAWLARIREEYPEDTAGLDDDGVRLDYAHGCKYADTWDHLGDAREEYEMLADAYLELLEENARLLAANKDSMFHFENCRADLEAAQASNGLLRVAIKELIDVLPDTRKTLIARENAIKIIDEG